MRMHAGHGSNRAVGDAVCSNGTMQCYFRCTLAAPNHLQSNQLRPQRAHTPVSWPWPRPNVPSTHTPYQAPTTLGHLCSNLPPTPYPRRKCRKAVHTACTSPICASQHPIRTCQCTARARGNLPRPPPPRHSLPPLALLKRRLRCQLLHRPIQRP